jgi:hypothetical protein
VIFVAAIFALMLANLRANAQAEVDPDHYETPDSSSIQPKTVATDRLKKIQYEGKFTLPYKAHCKGNSLRKGAYTVSLEFDGTIGRVTLNRKNHTVKIDGVRQREAGDGGPNALLVESSGAKHELTAIRIAQLELLFEADAEPDYWSGAKGQNLERLPLIVANSK